MFIPIHDGKAKSNISLQWVTLGIIAINIAVFLITRTGEGSALADATTMALGHVPSVYNDLRVLPHAFRWIPDDYYIVTTLTSAFIHADFMHLLGNMLFLWVFADNVEDAMGHFRFLVFYLLCAFAAASAHALMYPISDSPLIGASGPASGVLAAYLLLHPKVRVWVLFLGRIPLKLPALYLLGGWIGYQVFMLVGDLNSEISWAAHVGGIVAGAILLPLFKRRDVPLFDRELDAAITAAESKPNSSPVITQEEKSRKPPWGRQQQ